MLGSLVLTAHLILETGLWEASLFRGLMSGLDVFFLGCEGGRPTVPLNTLFVPTTEESDQSPREHTDSG